MVHGGRVKRAVERVLVTELLSAQYEEEINTLTCLLLDRSSCVMARSIIQDELKEDNDVLPSVELAKLKTILFGYHYISRPMSTLQQANWKFLGHIPSYYLMLVNVQVHLKR
ncbi:Uncharacterized protein Adt_37182 [Abeliophyllum distichum]|uniref:Uncharacterized protein n=1 Tax=Abeliophyllum distichum TaxID=126358 RepID=A0ABD1QK55_9LAMI